jgi:spore coat protein U-like protein
MAVTANVNASCTLSAANLDFGIYDPIVANATQDLTASATISTTCTLGVTARVIMGNGLHSTTTLVRRGRLLFTTDYRHMSKVGSDSNLMYELYTNEGHTTVWNQSWFRNVVGSGFSEDLVVYGKVFKNQIDAAAGDYTDTVTIGVYY